jgi:heme exporter protein C
MRWETPVGVVGFALLVVGQVMGLFFSPPDRHMGEVARILYVHVPAAWLAMLTFTVASVAAAGFLFTGRRALDWVVESACEVGVVMTTMLIVLGSIFARPTWNVWWTWDPRLTSTAVMLLSFVGILVLRGAVADADRRAVFSAVTTLLGWINIPVVYFSVQWWASMHQLQSERRDVDSPMQMVLLLNTVAFTIVTIWYLAARWRIAAARGRQELPPPLPEAA